MFLQYTQRWSKETYKIYLSCNSNNLPGYFNLIITFSAVYSLRKRDHCCWKGLLTSASFTGAGFFYLDKEKEHVKLSSWHEQVFIVKFAGANGAFNEQRLVADFSLRRWCKRLKTMEGYFRAAPIPNTFKEKVRAFFKVWNYERSPFLQKFRWKFSDKWHKKFRSFR